MSREGSLVTALLSALLSVSAFAQQPVIDVPKAPAAGKLEELLVSADWGLHVNVLAPLSMRQLREYQASPVLRIAWDQTGLLVLAKVADTTPVEAENDLQLATRDSVEVFVARADQPTRRHQVAISPGRAKAFPEPRLRFNYGRDPEGDEKPTAEVVRKVDEQGYTLLVRLPWKNLQITPSLGGEVLVQVLVNEADESGSRVISGWYPAGGAGRNPRNMYRVRLAEQAGPAAEMTAVGEYQKLRRAVIIIRGAEEMAGKQVSIKEKDQTLATTSLQKVGSMVMGRVLLPLSAEHRSYGPLTITAENQQGVSLQLPPLPDPEQLVEEAEFSFSSCLFAAARFPDCDFRDPLYVEDVIGQYTIKTTFYDAKHNVVTEARTPGRYGAICEIRADSGRVYKRYCTLYRTPVAFQWWDAAQAAPGQLPPAFGLDPRLGAQEGAAVGTAFSQSLDMMASQNDRWASLLAGLAEMTPTANGQRSVGRLGPYARTQQWWDDLRVKVEGYRYDYALTTPADFQPDGTRKYPLILFLHGAGERGRDLKKAQPNQASEFLKNHPELEFIVAAPLCPPTDWWSAYMLSRVVDEVQQKYPVDPDRVYITGFSMGGYATWDLAHRYPGRFAAVAPICGIGDKDDMAQVRDLPVWAFHGDKDPMVAFDQDLAGVNLLRKLGGRVRFTAYPGVGHDAWTQTYKNPELYTWLLQQKRGEPQQPRAAATQPATRP